MVSKANGNSLRTSYEFILDTGFLGIATCKGANSCWVYQDFSEPLAVFGEADFQKYKFRYTGIAVNYPGEFLHLLFTNEVKTSNRVLPDLNI